jgi:hypothetical protein
MAAPMPDWFEGPGMYRALEINSGELALGGAEIDPIPPNCEFIVIGHNQESSSRLTLARLIIRAEKIETKSYYDFIVDDCYKKTIEHIREFVKKFPSEQPVSYCIDSNNGFYKDMVAIVFKEMEIPEAPHNASDICRLLFD